MGVRNRVGIGLLYRPARLNRLAESILRLLKSLKMPALEAACDKLFLAHFPEACERSASALENID